MGGRRQLPVPLAADKPPAEPLAEFDDFYRSSYSRLTSQLHAYLGDRAEAEDVAQEAFVRTWQRWSVVSEYEDPVSWVRRVAWNLATSRLRRVSAAARILRRYASAQVEPALDPDHVALVAALRKLPDRHRRAIVLHYLAGMPVAEVAADIGVPRGTVLSWLHRGRAQLAVHLGSEERRR
ncbi:RNA polymerase sigma factor [Asanoa siamensis]|uniref:RNA polymerase sigma24 factor n=1 Tax=Asanoa siamensis TaxID=926357 RepID=A0ABQ4D1N2_9ACTN|nr:SigE family RNA polymerase sigma factor [Asanoa siamensis]GIF77433.1 RNA polymerase sigma24 factor [Asanoa siamensis]